MVHADVQFIDQSKVYRNVKFTVLRGLVAKVILGISLLKQHESITLKLNGLRPPSSLVSAKQGGLSVACSKLPYPTLFPGVDSSVKPIKLPSRKYSIEERKFIALEVVSLLKGWYYYEK